MNYHNAGKVQASSQPQDMRLQRMLGHFTTLVPKSPKKVLVIGCGAGATAGAVSIDQNVETLVIAEIEPLVPRVVSRTFRRAQFQRRPQSEDARRHRRCAALSVDDRRDIRRDHVRSARPVGQGGGDALHEGVLRAGEVEAESRGHRHAVRAAVRKHAGSGEERDRHVLRGVSERRHLGQHAPGARLRYGADGHGRAAALQRGRMGGAAQQPGSMRSSQGVAARDQHLLAPWICSPTTPAVRQT